MTSEIADTLRPCPRSPNCVSSDADGSRHRVEPFRLCAASEVAWAAAVEAVASLPRTEIVARDGTRLHAICRSAVFRFADDLELRLRPDQGLIAVRSASRLGWSDLGVNRRRIERLRAVLRERGVVA